MERYLKILKSYKRMPLEMQQRLVEGVRRLTIKKNEIVQPCRSNNDCIYFVERGMFHLFGAKDGRQVTFRFKKEDEFIIALKSTRALRSFPDQGIQALEDGILWIIPGPLVSLLYETYTQFVNQLVIITTKDWLAIEEALLTRHRDGDAIDYNRLYNCSRGLIGRVPIRCLASYLNVPERALRHMHSLAKDLKIPTVRKPK